MHGHTLLQYDDEDLCVHQGGVQEPAPHEQQAAQEVAKVSEAHTLAKKDAVVVPPQHTDIAVVAVGTPRRSVGFTDITVPPAQTHAISFQEHSLDAGVGFDEEPGVPADVPQHKVLGQQMEGLPVVGPHRPLPLRLQGSLFHDEVTHFRGDREYQHGVEDDRQMLTVPLNQTKKSAAETRHASN